MTESVAWFNVRLCKNKHTNVVGEECGLCAQAALIDKLVGAVKGSLEPKGDESYKELWCAQFIKAREVLNSPEVKQYIDSQKGAAN